MRRTVGTKAGAVLVALLTLALLSSRASPGFPWPRCPGPSAGRSPRRSAPSPSGRPAPGRPASEGQRASPVRHPRRYLGFYADAASACRA